MVIEQWFIHFVRRFKHEISIEQLVVWCFFIHVNYSHSCTTSVKLSMFFKQFDDFFSSIFDSSHTLYINATFITGDDVCHSGDEKTQSQFIAVKRKNINAYKT